MLGELADLAGEELAELDQVGAVALDGVVAEVLFEAQIVEELPNQWAEVLFLRMWILSVRCAVLIGTGWMRKCKP